jgi:hypothetical protein
VSDQDQDQICYYRIYREKMQALEIINRLDHGYLDELRELIGESLVNEFLSLGFIHPGYTLEKETWGINPLGKRYYEMTKPD